MDQAMGLLLSMNINYKENDIEYWQSPPVVLLKCSQMCHLCAHFCSDQFKVTPVTQDTRFSIRGFLCWVTALFPPLPQSGQSDMNSIPDCHIEVLKRMCISKGFIFFWEGDKQTHWLATANTLYLLGCSSCTRYWQNDKAGWDHFLKLCLSWGIKRRERKKKVSFSWSLS